MRCLGGRGVGILSIFLLCFCGRLQFTLETQREDPWITVAVQRHLSDLWGASKDSAWQKHNGEMVRGLEVAAVATERKGRSFRKPWPAQPFVFTWAPPASPWRPATVLQSGLLLFLPLNNVWVAISKLHYEPRKVSTFQFLLCPLLTRNEKMIEWLNQSYQKIIILAKGICLGGGGNHWIDLVLMNTFQDVGPEFVEASRYWTGIINLLHSRSLDFTAFHLFSSFSGMGWKRSMTQELQTRQIKKRYCACMSPAAKTSPPLLTAGS